MATDPPIIYVTPPGPAGKIAGLLRRAMVATYEDNCLSIAKGVAYSGLLAFFPVLSSVAAISVYVNAEAATRLILRLLFDVAPQGVEDLFLAQLTEPGSRPIALIFFAGLFALWGASEVVLSLVEGFNAAYRIPTGRPWVRARVVALGLVFISVLPVFAASALILFGSRVEEWVGHNLGLLAEGVPVRGWVALAGSIVRSAIAGVTIVLVISLLYLYGPNRKQRFGMVWPGAVVAMAFWLPSTIGFAWWANNVVRYNVVYGSLGVGIALLVWMYVISLIALFGCEYNVARELMLRSQKNLVKV
jgi:membrane protein